MSKDYNVDSFVVDLSFNDKVTKKLAEIEKKTLSAANRIETALNKAFKASPNFVGVVNSAKVAAAAVNQSFSHVNYAGNGKFQIHSLEVQGIQAAKKVGEAFNRVNPKNIPTAPVAAKPQPARSQRNRGLKPSVEDVNKVSAAVTALEKKVTSASVKMEQHLNRAFHVNPKFGNLVQQVNNTANAVKVGFKKGFSIANPAVKEVKQVEQAGVTAAKRIGEAMRKAYRVSDYFNPPAVKGSSTKSQATGNRQPSASRVDSMASTQYYSGLTRRLERMGGNGIAQARKLRQGVYSAATDAKISGDVDKFRLRVRQLTNIASQWADANKASHAHMTQLDSGLGRLAVSAGALVGAWSLAKNALDAGVKRDSTVSSSDAIFGKDQSKQAQQFAYDFSQQLGMKYTDTLKGFTDFAAGSKTTMGYEGAKDMYANMATFGRLRGLDTEQMKGITVALTQMASKGQIQAEELRGQLGDRLPGSEQIFADALGLDLPAMNKLMKDGKLLTKDVFPKVSAYIAKMNEDAGGLDKASKMAVSGIGRIENAVEDNLAQSFKGAETGVGAFSASLANLLNDSTDISNAIGSGFGSMLQVAAHWVDWADYAARQTDAAVLRMKAWYLDLDEGQKKLVDSAGKLTSEVGTAAAVVLSLAAAVKSLKVAASIAGLGGKAAASAGGITAGEAAAGGAAAGGLGKKLLGKLPGVGGLFSLYAAGAFAEEALNPETVNAITDAKDTDTPFDSPFTRWITKSFGERGETGKDMPQYPAMQPPASLYPSPALESAGAFFENIKRANPEPASESGSRFDKASLFNPVQQPRVQIAAPQITANQAVTVQVDMGGYTREFQGSVVSHELENVNINTEHLED